MLLISDKRSSLGVLPAWPDVLRLSLTILGWKHPLRSQPETSSAVLNMAHLK